VDNIVHPVQQKNLRKMWNQCQDTALQSWQENGMARMFRAFLILHISNMKTRIAFWS